MIYLKEGHVVGMGLPLHPDIEARRRNGHLTRVHADGSAWQDSDGDPFAVLPAAAEPDNDSAPTTTTEPGIEEPPAGHAPGGAAERAGRPATEAARQRTA